MNVLLSSRRADIAILCRRYGVARLDLFGSAATEGFNPARSDFDFVADFSLPAPTAEYADRWTSEPVAICDHPA